MLQERALRHLPVPAWTPSSRFSAHLNRTRCFQVKHSSTLVLIGVGLSWAWKRRQKSPGYFFTLTTAVERAENLGQFVAW